MILPLSFSDPLLLLLLVPALWLSWIIARRSFAALGPARRLISNLLRGLILLLLVFALGGVELVRVSDRLAVIFVVDVSDSVNPETLAGIRQQIIRAAQGKRREDLIGIVTFGRDAQVEKFPSQTFEEAELEKYESKPQTNFTDISQALRLAAAALPENAQRRVVLITDGNQNLGDAVGAARSLVEQGVELYLKPLPTRKTPEVLVREVRLPPVASQGETVRLGMVFQSNLKTKAKLAVSLDGRLMGVSTVELEEGKNPFSLPIQVDQPGFHTVSVRIEPEEDTQQENNLGFGFIQVEGPPRVLYVSGDPREDDLFARLISSQQIQVDFIRPQNLPFTLEGLASYDVIIFSDVLASEVSLSQMELIKRLVSDFGRTFMMFGGDRSFGPGGYFRTPIEEILPVRMDIQRDVFAPSTAVALLIDKSGSMAMTVNGVEKLAMAREAAKLTVEVLARNDYIGVQAFDSLPQWIVPVQQNANKEEIKQMIERLQPGGGTDLFPGLVEAGKQLNATNARAKHIIVLTDGIVAPADFGRLLKKFAEDKITISSVAVGTDADVGFLRWLAEQGGGNFYQATDPSTLPRIFTRETFLASKNAIIEEPFRPVERAVTELSESLPMATTPPLLGYVATTPKPTAQLPLVTHKNDPLLAHWHFGLGKTLAWTSDAKNRWAAQWIGWPGYKEFFSAMLRWGMREVGDTTYITTVEQDQARGHLVVEALSKAGTYLTAEELSAKVFPPQGEPLTVKLEQTEPGRYEAWFPLRGNGSYLVSVVRSKDEVDQAVATAGLAVSYSPEYRDLDPNQTLFARLMEISPSPPPSDFDLSKVFELDRKPATRREPAWQLALTLALILWIVDIGVRRLLFTAEDLMAVREFILAKLGLLALVHQLGTTEETLAKLKGVKQRTPRSIPARQAREKARAGRRPSPSGQPAAGSGPRPSQKGEGRDATEGEVFIREDVLRRLGMREAGPAVRKVSASPTRSAGGPGSPAKPKSEEEFTERLKRIKRRYRK